MQSNEDLIPGVKPATSLPEEMKEHSEVPSLYELMHSDEYQKLVDDSITFTQETLESIPDMNQIRYDALKTVAELNGSQDEFNTIPDPEYDEPGFEAAMAELAQPR